MAPKPDRLAPSFGMVATLFAKAPTQLGLATTIAALWLTVVPITGAVANEQISAARAAAIHECNLLAPTRSAIPASALRVDLDLSCALP